VGCGTGLNQPWVTAAVGPTGTAVGLDASPDMLARAGWTSVRFVRGDADEAGELVRPG